MKTRKILMTTGAVVLSLGLALPASALSVQGVTDTAADISGQLTNPASVGGSIDARGSLEARATTSQEGAGGVSVSGDADASGKATTEDGKTNAGFGASIKAMLSTLISGSTPRNDDDSTGHATGSAASNAGGNASGSATLGGTISAALKTILVTRADVENGSVKATSENAASVRNETDLRGYVAAQLQKDSNIEAIELASDSVAVTYKEKAHLFAVIPVTVNATATVDASGNVEVSYPWYSFLMATDRAALEAKIQDRVSALLAASGDASASVSAAAEATASGSATIDDDGVEASADADATARTAGRLSAETQARLVAEVRSAMAEALAEADGATDLDASMDSDVNADGTIDVR